MGKKKRKPSESSFVWVFNGMPDARHGSPPEELIYLPGVFVLRLLITMVGVLPLSSSPLHLILPRLPLPLLLRKDVSRHFRTDTLCCIREVEQLLQPLAKDGTGC